MAHTPESILEQFKHRDFAPIYFLQGEEPFYIDQIANYIENNALSEADRGFNQVVIYGKDTDVATILSHARRFPMMADRQVVIVKEAQTVQDLEKENGIKLLESYLVKPLSSTILVFCYKHKTLDGRKSLARNLDKNAILVTTKKLYDNQIPAWVSAYIKDKGLKISAKGCQLLSDFIGSDLSRLAGEIDKLAINLKPNGIIDEDLIHKNVGISKEYNIFELQNSIVAQDVLKANRILQYFEANPKAAPAIPNITILFSFFSKILQLHYLRASKEPISSKTMGISDFSLRQIQNAAQVYNYNSCLTAIKHIREADLRAKGIEAGIIVDAQIMKELVFKLLHPFKVAA